MESVGRSPATNSLPSGAVDLLSKLTDDVLLFILTFLPLSSAIRTGVLSTRWRDLWKRRWPAPGHFDFTSFHLPANLFISHISHSLRFRHPPPRRIDTLRIAFRPRSTHLPDLRQWMSYAARCLAADITLDLTSPNLLPELYPTFVFDRKSSLLQRLRVAGCRIPRLLDFKKMPSLKTVVLCGVHIKPQAVSKLLQCCRLLRTLELRGCFGLDNILINARRRLRLTRLAIIDCPGITSIHIAARNLRSIHVRGELIFTRLPDFRALEDAYIAWGTTQHSHLPIITDNWMDEFAKLAGVVRILTLCGLTLQFIALFRASVIFSYLRELQLMIPILTNEDIGDIFNFFKLCAFPLLEKLFIELPTAWYGSAMDFMERGEDEVEGPMLVWFENLKVIKINNFTGYYNEMRLASFLLQSASKLEFLILVPIRVQEEDDADLWIHNQRMLSFACHNLHSLPRVSPDAVIIFEEESGRSMFRPTHDVININ